MIIIFDELGTRINENIKRANLHAVRPWESIEARTSPKKESWEKEPQEKIDKCLESCPFKDGDCVNCLSSNSSRNPVGRPKKIDLETLKEVLKIKKRTDILCKELGISANTLRKYKKQMREMDL